MDINYVEETHPRRNEIARLEKARIELKEEHQTVLDSIEIQLKLLKIKFKNAQSLSAKLEVRQSILDLEAKRSVWRNCIFPFEDMIDDFVDLKIERIEV